MTTAAHLDAGLAALGLTLADVEQLRDVTACPPL